MSTTHDRERSPKGASRRAGRSRTGPSRTSDEAELEALQQAIGNASMSRLLDPSTAEEIEAQLGAGSPLEEVAPIPGGDEKTADGVRLHDDATAASVSKQLGAVAFTFGDDIFLAGDAPALDSAEGQRVLRHELTHVKQRDSRSAGRPRRVSHPASHAEREATHVADRTSPTAASAPPDAVHRQEEEEYAMPMPADAVHRQVEEEEEELLQTMPADTVHRQEEEELQLMPADTVHRQEEEEEVALMPADTVHRQEEEEEVALMPADTVHRQEEEELQLMPADTVHRHGEEEEESLETMPAETVYRHEVHRPPSPETMEYFEVTVRQRLAEARELLASDPPNVQGAFALLAAATETLRELAGSYRASDPGLAATIGRLANANIGSIERLRPYVGERLPMADIINGVNQTLGMANGIRPRLHRGVGPH